MASLPQDESARRQCSTFLIAPDAGFRPRGCRETGGSFDQARCMRGGYGYYGRRGYGVPLAVGAVGAAAVGAAAAGSYYGYGYPAYSYPAYGYPAYGYPACDPYIQAC